MLVSNYQETKLNKLLFNINFYLTLYSTWNSCFLFTSINNRWNWIYLIFSNLVEVLYFFYKFIFFFHFYFAVIFSSISIGSSCCFANAMPIGSPYCCAVMLTKIGNRTATYCPRTRYVIWFFSRFFFRSVIFFWISMGFRVSPSVELWHEKTEESILCLN